MDANLTVMAGLVALAVAAACTPVVMVLARKLKALDHPGERKHHGKSVPLLGGAAIAAGVVAGFAAGGVAGRFAVVLAAAGAVFLVGLLDDLRRAPVWLRLLVETGAAVAVVASGVRATFLVEAAWLTWPATVLWIVAMTNAFNFLDNMDGLSAGVAAIAAGIFLLVCLKTSPDQAPALAAVAGAAAGFLPFNFRPARIFMGDAGALALGFLLGTLSISMTFYEYGAAIPLALAAPALVLAIPVFDMASVLYIRLREGRPLTSGDRRHFSHRLVALGMSERTAVATIYLAAVSIGLGATLLGTLESWSEGYVLLVQAAGVLTIVVLMERAGKSRVSDRDEPDGRR